MYSKVSLVNLLQIKLGLSILIQKTRQVPLMMVDYIYLQTYVSVSATFEGAKVIFHMFSLNSSINNYQFYHFVNVQGKLDFLCEF